MARGLALACLLLAACKVGPDYEKPELAARYGWPAPATTLAKLGAGKVSDWEYLGIASSPTVDGDFVYIVTNRFEVICLDVQGQANGNQGSPITKEGALPSG